MPISKPKECDSSPSQSRSRPVQTREVWWSTSLIPMITRWNFFSRQNDVAQVFSERARMAANFDLRGRVALVTGGAQGLGASIARALAAHGATIALLDIQAESVAAAATQLAHDTGQNAVGLACDTREKDQV